MSKQDIRSRADIERLVDAFYGRVQADPLLGPVFNEVARVNWQTHLPKMYDFWATLLLDERTYSGNPMTPHLALSRKTPLGEAEFETWIRLFNATVDEHFAGPKADEARQRAGNIARLMRFKVNSL